MFVILLYFIFDAESNILHNGQSKDFSKGTNVSLRQIYAKGE